MILQAYQAFHEETRSRWHLGKANANLGARVLPPVTCSLTGTCPEDGKAAIAGGQPIQDVRRSPDERREAAPTANRVPVRRLCRLCEHLGRHWWTLFLAGTDKMLVVRIR